MTADTHTSSPRAIRLSRTKILFQLVLFLLCTAGSVGLLYLPTSPSRISNFPAALGSGGTLVFAVCSLYCLVRLFDFRPGLVVDDLGLIDNSSTLAAGRILWDDIVRLEIPTTPGHRQVTVVTADASKYADKGSLVRRMLHSLDPQATGITIRIPARSLNFSYSELLYLLDSAKLRYESTTLRTAREAIRTQDYETLESLLDARFGNLIGPLQNDYQQATEWSVRDAIVFVLQNVNDERLKPLMEHALDSPLIRTRAIAISLLRNDYVLFDRFLVDWNNDASRIDQAISEYRGLEHQ